MTIFFLRIKYVILVSSYLESPIDFHEEESSTFNYFYTSIKRHKTIKNISTFLLNIGNDCGYQTLIDYIGIDRYIYNQLTFVVHKTFFAEYVF